MLVGPAPYIHERESTASLAWGTSLALLPAFLWGLYCFGPRSALVVGVAIVAACIAELLIGLLHRDFSLGDGTAFLTGFLIGLAMPPGVALYVPAAASLFAILVVKAAFGGLGSNWMNPALAGLVFSLLNWPREMGTWMLPHQLAGAQALSGATPLGILRASPSLGNVDLFGLLSQAGLKPTDFDRSITAFLNEEVFGRIGASLPSGYMDLFFGNRPGAIGELSGILLLAASILLLSRRMIRWEIPASIFASYGALVWAFGGLSNGGAFFSGDILFELFSGSFILVAFFMATDPVTSPSTRVGMLIYGLGIGALTFLLRSFGSFPEGTAFAVVMMDCVVPLIEKINTPTGRREKEASRG
jgi:Na+-translocating ferredoxin:NAD+ oxidoreductase subunit D